MPPKHYPTFGEVIAEYRARQGLSVYSVARRAGLSQTSVACIEAGTTSPQFETTRLLAAALGVSLGQIEARLAPVVLPPVEPVSRGRRPGKPTVQ